MIERLFPRQADNRFEGHPAALWLLGLLLFVKLAMSLNSILNTREVAVGADGIPLNSFGAEGARQVLLLFALMAVSHLFIELVALVALVRYRALVPFIYLVLLGEHLTRRAVARSFSMPGTESTDIALIVNYGLLAAMLLGLLLSLLPIRAKDTD